MSGCDHDFDSDHYGCLTSCIKCGETATDIAWDERDRLVDVLKKIEDLVFEAKTCSSSHTHSKLEQIEEVIQKAST